MKTYTVHLEAIRIGGSTREEVITQVPAQSDSEALVLVRSWAYVEGLAVLSAKVL